MRPVVFIFLVTSGYTSFAQIEKGTTLADLNVNAYGSTYNGYYTIYQPDGSIVPLGYTRKNFQGSYTLAYNRFFNNSILWGLQVGYNHSRSEESSVSTSISRQHGVSFGPAVQKYFKLVDKFYFTLDLSPTVTFRNNSNDYEGSINDSRSKSMIYRLSLSPGLTYILTERWWVSAGFGSFYYSQTRTKDVSDKGNPVIKEQNYGLFMNASSFSIGLQYVLGSKPVK